MDSSLAITLTLCHQFNSEYYNSRMLKNCIAKATESAEDMLGNINIVFEDIEETMENNIIHENVANTIRKAHIVIFELSDINPNVLYELGIASGLKKPIIIIREERSEGNKLPTDINQFIYLKYNKDKLDKFHNILSGKIKQALDGYDEIDFISDTLKEKILDSYINTSIDKVFNKLEDHKILKVLKTNSHFSNYFEHMIKNTKMNIYYIGTLGFLTKEQQWIDFYKKHFHNEKIFSRIVYMQTLYEFYTIYDDIDMLIDYCVWLATNYYLVKNEVLTISKSNDISIWKKGISFIVFDEEEILVSTGSFQNEYNNKGFVLKNKSIAKMFKEYAKILAINSKKVKQRDFAYYFSLSESEKLNQIPENILSVLQNLDDNKNGLKELRNVCSEYILEFISKSSFS